MKKVVSTIKPNIGSGLKSGKRTNAVLKKEEAMCSWSQKVL